MRVFWESYRGDFTWCQRMEDLYTADPNLSAFEE